MGSRAGALRFAEDEASGRAEGKESETEAGEVVEEEAEAVWANMEGSGCCFCEIQAEETPEDKEEDKEETDGPLE